MPEKFVFDISELLLKKLSSYAYQEFSRAYGVYEDLRQFKDTLTIVRCLLLDAEEKKSQQHMLHEWLRQIRNICYDAEDVLERFELQEKKKQVVKVSGSTSMKVCHFFSSSNPLAFRIKMANQIRDIRDRLDKVASDGNKFKLEININPGLVIQRREMTYPAVDASRVIGRESDKEDIITLLMQQHPHGDGYGDKSLCVIPIVGIGGLGKTTLAKLVFNDKRMDKLFQLKMWVCVSDDFDIRRIIINIINSATASIFTSASASMSGLALHENIKDLGIVELVSRLRQKISGKRFLLVLDDVWNDDRAKWIELKDLINVGPLGSKIVMTTRSKSIASMMGNVPPYILKGLSRKNCLSLFIQWAFKEGEIERYPNLVEIGKEIVKKCQGVPLAVRTLGSSLFSIFDLSKWEFVRDSQIWNLEQKEHDILPALKLSYDQMPSYLRQCFACFSLFPKDHIFDSDLMYNIWVALGLVQSLNGSEKLDCIAREYIYELYSRSFIQDVSDYGSVCYFKVHDLIHDLALYVAREDFVAVDSHTRNIPHQIRHLSIVENDPLDLDLFPKSRSVRIILFPILGGVGLENESAIDTWVSRYKYLRYLGLSGCSIETLPNSIAKLEHLRFLDLSHNRKIKRLPNSFCKLLNLQVLLLQGCTKLENLPRELGKMISLRQINLTTKQDAVTKNEFGSLTHLRSLGFYYCYKLLKWEKLASLETLFIVSCGRVEFIPLHMFPNLQTLYISGCERLNLLSFNESWIQTLKMKHLHLEDFLELFELPRWIEFAKDTLETMTIVKFPKLKMLPKFLINMSHLKRLRIHECPLLTRIQIPRDMHRLTSLEELHIYDCPELYRKYHPQCGAYWPLIAHIKNISIEEPSREEE